MALPFTAEKDRCTWNTACDSGRQFGSSPLRSRLAELRLATTTVGPRTRGQPIDLATRRLRPGRVSPETAESRRVQGEYMGLLRRLTGRGRARIKSMAKEFGREAAIKEMRAARNR